MEQTYSNHILIGSLDEAQSLHTLVNSYGYHAVSFSSGLDILTYLKDTTPSLMFLDANLPVINGTSIVERAKKLSRLRSVPAIVLVDPFNAKLRAQTEWCKPDQILYKPLHASAVTSVLRAFHQAVQPLPPESTQLRRAA